MKNSILILLSAALPVFAQGPAPEAAPAPVAPAPQVAPADAKAAFLAKYDADKDGKVSAAEAFAAKRDFMRANADKFGKKPGMRKHEGRRHGKPGMNHEGRRHDKPGMKHEGRRPQGPRMQGNFAPKDGEFRGQFRKPGMDKGFRPQGPRMQGDFAPKCGEFQGQFRKPAPKFNGCRCGKKHAPGVQPKLAPAA